MTSLERHYRLLTIRERIEQIEGELIALMDETNHHAQRNRLHLAGIHLSRSAAELRAMPTATTGPELEQVLEASIESVRDKKQCEQVGGSLPFEKFL